jgi:hypothetical protein
MSSDLVFWHRTFSMVIFDKLPLWRQAHSFPFSGKEFFVFPGKSPSVCPDLSKTFFAGVRFRILRPEGFLSTTRSGKGPETACFKRSESLLPRFSSLANSSAFG